MKFFNWEIGKTKRKTPSQKNLVDMFGGVGAYNRFGLGFTVEDFNVFLSK